MELARNDYLVSSTNLAYDESVSITYLTSATHVGYLLDDEGNNYMTKSLSSFQFEYSRFLSDKILATLRLREIDMVSSENMSYGVDGSNYQWIDLNGEGLFGVLSDQATRWFYKRNLSANNQIQALSETITAAKLGPIENICPKPSSTDRALFSDVQGDDLMELVRMNVLVWGFSRREFKLGEVSGWLQFREFNSFPNVNS